MNCGDLAKEPLWSLTLDPPFLVVQFPRPQEVASWAVVGGGRRQARTVAWLEVRNADLPPHVDPVALLRQRLETRGLSGAVGLLTSRRIDRHHQAHATWDGRAVSTLATVGLSNALRVGDEPGPLSGLLLERAGRRGPPAAPTGTVADIETIEPIGTINILVALSAPLTEAAAWEAMSIAAEARTAAVIAAGVESRRSSQIATGTGTDCLVLAWPADSAFEPVAFSGKHTATGHLIGETVFQTVRAGVATWLEENPQGRTP